VRYISEFEEEVRTLRRRRRGRGSSDDGEVVR
jgi:hypothetical protein